MKGLFITGTDTGVGKTVVTATILAWLRHQGIKTGVMKPIETGVDAKCSSAANSDALFLMETGNIEDPLEEVCPFRLKHAASPYQAALIDNRTLQPKSILSAYDKLAEKNDWMLVEGIGGVRVPITQEYGVVELIRDLGLPALVVTRYELGTLNHTLMTLETLRHSGIAVKGVVFNRTGPGKLDAIAQDQPRIIKELTDIPVLAEFPYIDKLSTESFSPEYLKKLAGSVDFAGLTRN
ncbi:MAG: dethiobiotin synthase [Nitrospinota bacterium]|nr:dethiobiotin synthase [Nitrospinota bacterium]